MDEKQFDAIKGLMQWLIFLVYLVFLILVATFAKGYFDG